MLNRTSAISLHIRPYVEQASAPDPRIPPAYNVIYNV